MAIKGAKASHSSVSNGPCGEWISQYPSFTGDKSHGSPNPNAEIHETARIHGDARVAH